MKENLPLLARKRHRVAQRQRGPPKLRPPKEATVSITCPPNEVRRARQRIKLGEVGVGDLRTKCGITGALVLKIPVPDGPTRADLLAEKLGEALRDQEGVKIARSQKMVDVRMQNLEDSICPEEVAEKIAEVGACA